MNVEEELMKINFAKLSRVKEDLLRRLLLLRKLRREKERELDLEELESVSAARDLRMEDKSK